MNQKIPGHRLFVVVLLFFAAAAGADSLPLIDTHSHFQTVGGRDLRASRDAALANMDRMNIARSLLMPPPFSTPKMAAYYDIEALLFAAKEHPGRFSLLGGSSLNVMIHNTAPAAVDEAVRARFRQRALEIAALGAVGFGEMAVMHVSIPAMGPQHAFEDVPADHPLFLLLADIAAGQDMPIDLHFDLVPEDMPLPDLLRPNALNPRTLTANMPAFKRLLGHNTQAKIVWVHVGFEPLLTRDPEIVASMLKEHSNLYMSFRLNRGAPKPAATLSPNGRMKPAWVKLVEAFPDRFMLGSDAFYAREGSIARGSSDEGMKNLRGLIDQLPDGVAAKVASGNAMKLYRLERFPAK